MNKADRDRLDQLFEIGCIVCRKNGNGWVAPEIHHLKGHPWSGMGKRASHQHTIPLCPAHHRYGGGNEVGYHQSPAEFQERYGSQADLLLQVDEEYFND